MIPLFLHKSPALLKTIYNNFVWELPNNENKIYLTFDDGPIPDITEWVLEQLRQYEATATFFCVGENIIKYPQVFQKVVESQHTVGNHTYNHLKGWGTNNETYVANVAQCQQILPVGGNLFRPPYGRIKLSQAKELSKDYKIIMWDVLSGDFEKYISPERCLHKTLQYTRSGSIIVLHDSIKAWRNMNYVLPRLLEHLSEKGFQFCALNQIMN